MYGRMGSAAYMGQANQELRAENELLRGNNANLRRTQQFWGFIYWAIGLAIGLAVGFLASAPTVAS